jgi:transcriptional regulator with XRE-family HTH domain
MIADRLKLARRKAGFSLRDLSAAMDGKVTAQAIGKYERC